MSRNAALKPSRRLRWAAVSLLLALPLLGCTSSSKAVESLPTAPPSERRSTNEDVAVQESAFHWDGSTIYYVFTAGNSADGLSYEDVAYHVDFYDKDGDPVAGNDGRFAIMWPGDTLATAGFVAASKEPTEIEVSFASGEGVEVTEERGFPVEEGRFEAAEFGGRVVALIQNPYDEDLSELTVTAVLLGEEDKILAGGTTTLLLLQAGGKAVVTIPIIGKPPAEPTGVSVYTTFSPLTVELLR